MRLALYQPEIPQNTATLLRLGACLGISIDLIEPCGFIFSRRTLRRAGMDYIDHVEVIRYVSWEVFLNSLQSPPRKRLVLVMVDGDQAYTDFHFQESDVILMGRESSGIEKERAAHADCKIKIPMLSGFRSLNLALAAGMVMGEALRQTNQFPIPPL